MMKHGLFRVFEIKTELHVKITKNCKALIGRPKEESSYGNVHPLSNQHFSPAHFILLLVLLSVITITDLFFCYLLYKWDVKFIHWVLQSTETNEGCASTFTGGNLNVLLHYSAMAH